MLCNCISHTEEEIREMISERNYSSFDEFQEESFVGTLCGRCLEEVRTIYNSISD